MIHPRHLVASNFQKIEACIYIKVFFVDPEDVRAIFSGHANVLGCLAEAEAVAG